MKFWANVRTSGGGMMRVTTFADSAYNATEYFRSVYGDRLMTESACAVPPNEL